MTDIYRGADAQIDTALYKKIAEQSDAAIRELIDASGISAGQILVVGCSSSEILGSKIGHGSSFMAAEAAFDAIYKALWEKGIYLAAQCCEHLNRAVVIERAAAERYNLEIVSAIPQPKAGGSFATKTYENLSDPVLVESVRAHAGIDIGGTLIGMHLRAVAVPVRLTVKSIGEASILCARTRPKYIGGERAKY